ncbi:tRNA (N6-isopentenyl adenosine(37)-C2)-methylthiotransferase MiaB [Amylibacter sp.]|nr:tRNA (N6-isopentenyl adenosine(37)-C2)-methylthiotransferase MiaB [bacterium]MDB9739880.1 tRNA (N6-isopentenyl adenosine(37)-C2)-methylthiotransferase MiaB [Amylibacter sp.]MDB9806432.1 tRNA (N6-isopentenyl adenosine(37)-C2)-methylthiotransferase MiaB [Amylibacter sp.]MDB9960192.1 tRNA (N6-isopentenyl adenosine(37)-C2)-methylthiotransferase MiaB [Amylibacter sp.]MDC1257607.1 tRNA (N6-isopentenyl adenosine(37)-C2)-methylthiotransferase MiaB [Amylibacter sp.]
MSKTKNLYIKTFGCQMNVYDSERMATSLGADGYNEVSSPEEADMILLNTCHIREKAAEKIYSDLGRFKSLKAKNPDLKIGVTGCVAQAEGEEIIKRQPLVDIVVGPQAYHRLPAMAKSVENGKKVVDTDFPEEDKFEHLPTAPKSKRAPSAFLTVQEGCDKFCAFCVVPFTRGAEASRPVLQIFNEAKDLVERGVRDITLLGQNVNAYHGSMGANDATLPQLIKELSKIEDLKRIRFTTSHPNDMTQELIDAHGEVKKLMPYLHLPVQSGSDKILKAMNRKHTTKSYIKVIEKLRIARPDIALSGDFIVGFPGETNDDFEQTLELVREVKYAQAYSFKYSTRPGTPAAENKHQVPEELKAERLSRLQTLLSTHQKEFMGTMVGKILPVLLERPGRLDGQLVGRSEYLHGVHANIDQAKIGDIVNLRILGADTNSLRAEFVSK